MGCGGSKAADAAPTEAPKKGDVTPAGAVADQPVASTDAEGAAVLAGWLQQLPADGKPRNVYMVVDGNLCQVYAGRLPYEQGQAPLSSFALGSYSLVASGEEFKLVPQPTTEGETHSFKANTKDVATEWVDALKNGGAQVTVAEKVAEALEDAADEAEEAAEEKAAEIEKAAEAAEADAEAKEEDAKKHEEAAAEEHKEAEEALASGHIAEAVAAEAAAVEDEAEAKVEEAEAKVEEEAAEKAHEAAKAVEEEGHAVAEEARAAAEEVRTEEAKVEEAEHAVAEEAKEAEKEGEAVAKEAETVVEKAVDAVEEGIEAVFGGHHHEEGAAAAATGGDVPKHTKAGMMDKRGKGSFIGIGRGWKERWIVAAHGGVRYYESREKWIKNPNKPLRGRTIPLGEFIVRRVTEGPDAKDGFLLIPKGKGLGAGRTWEFRAGTDDERKAWIEAMATEGAERGDMGGEGLEAVMEEAAAGGAEAAAADAEASMAEAEAAVAATEGGAKEEGKEEAQEEGKAAEEEEGEQKPRAETGGDSSTDAAGEEKEEEEEAAAEGEKKEEEGGEGKEEESAVEKAEEAVAEVAAAL